MSVLGFARALALSFAVFSQAMLMSRPQGFSFTSANRRFITPSTPVVFSFSNPRDSAGSIKIVGLKGQAVTTININPGDTTEQWDGRVGGSMVSMGVYIYVLSVEDVVYSGTVVVLK